MAADAVNADRRRSSRFDLATHQKRFVAVADLAAYVDVERRAIIRMINTGALSGIKVGRAWRIDTESARAAFHVKRNDPD